MGACDFRCCTCLPLFVVMFGDSPNDLLNNLNEEHPLVVAVEYISKEESADVAAGSASAKHGVTGILAVQGAFAEHAAMLDRLGAPWKLVACRRGFRRCDRSRDPARWRKHHAGKLLRSTGLFEPIAAHIRRKAGIRTCAGMILLARKLDNDSNIYFGALDASCDAMRTAVSLARSPPPPISALLLAIPPFWLSRANVCGFADSASGAGSILRFPPIPSC